MAPTGRGSTSEGAPLAEGSLFHVLHEAARRFELKLAMDATGGRVRFIAAGSDPGFPYTRCFDCYSFYFGGEITQPQLVEQLAAIRRAFSRGDRRAVR